MNRKIFVTGTDTDVGKTFCSCVLTLALRSQGYSVRPYKPIVAGFENGENADLNAHLKACNLPLNPLDLTAYAYDEFIAPHIAANKTNVPIEFGKLDEGLEKAEDSQCDFIITEGAGGWCLPVNNSMILPEWPRLKTMEVLLVVGMKLGCLNHALLTVREIKNKGFKLLGFVTHSVTSIKMPYYEENLETLKKMLDCHFLGDIPYVLDGEPKNAIDSININLISGC